jgi:tetratricopeptide (TPR) repeat protein
MRYIIFTGLILFSLFSASCKKEWLEKKPNISLVIPTTLDDCQLLLDNNSKLNALDPALGEVGSDNYFKLYNDWLSAYEVDRNIYTWKKDVFLNYPSSEWNYLYGTIYYANAVLETLDKIKITPANTSQYNSIKGSALFFRAIAHFHLVQLFASHYNKVSADTDPGIPVKTSADINAPSVRGTVSDVYRQITEDLLSSLALLPQQVRFPTRPSSVAANALLASVYMNMGNYDESLKKADAALSMYHELINYNSLDINAASPFVQYNSEVIYHATQISYGIMDQNTTYVDTVLYNSYQTDDLRKYIFFQAKGGYYAFKGRYSGNITLFSGIATDEVYLLRAECYARKNNVAAAMNDLNTLLKTRWRTNTFKDFVAADQAAALSLILKERRKELVFRARRWNDLRRLNNDPLFAVTIKRVLNGEVFTLPPNDLNYVYPIPVDEIKISGLVQNPRH